MTEGKGLWVAMTFMALHVLLCTCKCRGRPSGLPGSFPLPRRERLGEGKSQIGLKTYPYIRAPLGAGSHSAYGL